MSESYLDAEEHIHADQLGPFLVPEHVTGTDHSRHRLVEARRKVGKAPVLDVAARVDALRPRAAYHLQQLGLPEVAALRVSHEFARLLTGLLLTRGLGPARPKATAGQALPDMMPDKCPKKRVFLSLLRALMPDLVELCTDRETLPGGREADRETLRRLRLDRLSVIARLCRARIAVSDTGEPSVRQLADALLAWQPDLNGRRASS